MFPSIYWSCLVISPKDVKTLGLICVNFRQALQQETRKVVVKKEEARVVLPHAPAVHKTEGVYCQLDLHPIPLLCC